MRKFIGIMLIICVVFMAFTVANADTTLGTIHNPTDQPQDCVDGRLGKTGCRNTW